MEAAGIEPAQDFNRRFCLAGQNALAWRGEIEGGERIRWGSAPAPRGAEGARSQPAVGLDS